VTSQGTIDAMPGELQMEAQVGTPGEALLAIQARDGGVHRHALTGARTGVDDRDELVAQHEAVPEGGVTDGALLEPMSVGAAQSHRQYPKQCFPVGRLVDRQLDVI